MMFKPANADEWLRTYYGADFEELTMYDQNTPGLVEKARAMVDAGAATEIELHALVCLMRIPQAQYILPALERVEPHEIVECGVGGNMGASTAVFLWYCEQHGAQLWSCDRTPSAMTGTRFASWEGALWHFYQIDSVEFLQSGLIPEHPALIFIDTIHSYDHTMKELAVARAMTHAIVLDDAEYPGFRDGIDGNLADLSEPDRRDHGSSEPGGVKRALAEFLETQPAWERIDVGHPNVAFLRRDMDEREAGE